MYFDESSPPARVSFRLMDRSCLGPPHDIEGYGLVQRHRIEDARAMPGYGAMGPLTKRSRDPDAASIAHTQCRPEAPRALHCMGLLGYSILVPLIPE